MLRTIIRVTIVTVGWYLVLPVLAHSADCSVTFGFTEPTSISGVIVEVDYRALPGDLPGSADAVACHGNIAGALTTFNDIEARGVLKAGIVRLAPFGGASLFSCTVSGATPVAGDFVVTAIDATDASLNSVLPRPAVGVTSIDCGSSRTTPTTTSTTTTTLAVPADGCVLRLSARSATPVSGLVFELHYDGSVAEVVGAAESAACKTLVADALGAYNDIEAESTLVGALVHVAGFAGSKEIVECELAAPVEPMASEFSVDVLDAVDPAGSDIVPLPAVAVSRVVCNGAASSPAGGPRNGDSDPAPIDPNSGSCRGDYDVVFASSEAGALSSLQLNVEYTGAPGGFVGQAAAVSCTQLIGAGAFASFNDDEALLTLRAGFISLAGFATPADLMRCRLPARG